MMVAWKAFQETDEFINALMWCTKATYDDGRKIDPLQIEQHAKGSLWLAFTKGMDVKATVLESENERVKAERDDFHDRYKQTLENNLRLRNHMAEKDTQFAALQAKADLCDRLAEAGDRLAFVLALSGDDAEIRRSHAHWLAIRAELISKQVV